MDPILQVLLSWQFVLFGLAIAAVVYVIRSVIEYFVSMTNFPKIFKLWNDLLLPIMPVFLGAGSAVAFKTFPYPDGLNTGSASRLMFGLVAGLLSGLLYRVFKSILVQKIDGVAQATGVAVPAVTTTTVTSAPTGDVIPADQMPPRGQV